MNQFIPQALTCMTLLGTATLIACSGATQPVSTSSPPSTPQVQTKNESQESQKSQEQEIPSAPHSATIALAQRLLRISKVIEDDRGRPINLDIPEIRVPYTEGGFGRGAANRVRIVGPGPKVGGRSSIIGMVDLAGDASQTVVLLGISVDHSINGLAISLSSNLLWVHDQTSYTTTFGASQVATIVEVLDRKELVSEAMRSLQAEHDVELERRKAERIEAQHRAEEEKKAPEGREKAATAKLKLAMIMYRQDRDKGRLRLEEIVEEFPETAAAAEASAVLMGKKSR
jgi:hypothetical protein